MFIKCEQYSGWHPVGPESSRVKFVLPEKLLKGTYQVEYYFKGEWKRAPVDIRGAAVTVLNVSTSAPEKGWFSSGDRVDLILDILPEQADNLTVAVYLEPPFTEKIELDRQSFSVEPGRQTTLNVSTQLRSFIAGTNELFYDIYTDGVLMTGGRATAEIGPGKIISVNAEPHVVAIGTKHLNAMVEVFGQGPGRLELKCNEKVVSDETIVLEGFKRLQFPVDVGDLELGMHYLQATLYFTDCLSTKSDWFEVIKSDVTPTPSPEPTHTPTPESLTQQVTPEPVEMLLESPQAHGTPPPLITPGPEPTTTPDPEDRSLPASGPVGMLIILILFTVIVIGTGRVKQ